MPVHDWSKVDAGAFHDFHTAWLVEIRNALNSGLLPSGYYALAEQAAGVVGPEFVFHRPRKHYLKKQRRLAIRHRSNDRLVACVEIVSQWNKSSAANVRAFAERAAGILENGINLLLMDLYPPTRRDPQGIHGAIWRALGGRKQQLHPTKHLTLASYDAAEEITAYVEPIAVGDRLKDMPLFLEAGTYIDVPLETIYRAAWRGVPNHLQQILAHP